MTHIVVTIQNKDEIRAGIEPHLADMLELRLDLDPTLLEVIPDLEFPVMATVRSRDQGGAFAGSPAEASALLERALEAGARYCDLELRRDDPRRFPPERTVLSHHDLSTPGLAARPEQLTALLAELTEPRPAVAKLACMVETAGELSTLLAAYETTTPPGDRATRLALVGMGPVGTPSRILARRFGAAMTWCAAPGSPPAAPGQLDARELVEAYGARELEPEGRVFAVVGHPVSHSASPTFHNATFARSPGPRDVYVPLDVPDLRELPGLAVRLGLAGASVTMPHKTRVTDTMKAKLAGEPGGGGVNTLWRDPMTREWLACSTDREGVRSALQRARFDLSGSRVAILGAGGAAAAAAVTAVEGGATVTIHARDPERAGSLAARIEGTRPGRWPAAGAGEERLDEADLVINATPVGMTPAAEVMPCAPHAFGAEAMLFDMVYSPVWTRWLSAGRLSGQKVVLGLSMFVWQALAQQQLWLGARGDDMLGRRALLQRLPPGHPVVWLVGPRGSGKSTVGRLLARRIRVPFIDIDECIRRRAGMPAGELLALRGEEVFRRVESSCVELDVLARRGEPLVVATGGGTVLEHGGVIAQCGIGIHLTAAAETLAARVQAEARGNAGTRPPLHPGANPLAEARRVLQDREPAYRRACSLVVATDRLEVDDVVAKIRGLLGSSSQPERYYSEAAPR